MSEIHILTDSAASLPKEAINDLPLSVIPTWIQVANHSFREGTEFDSAKLYELFRQGALPTTSQPSPGDFLEFFKPLVEQGKRVIAVLVTAKGSGTCASASIAAEMFPEGAVTVFDSATTAMGTGLQAIAAAEAARAGQSMQEIMDKLVEVRENIKVHLAVPTLQYLCRSGRISQAKALLAGILNIKVVLTTENGTVVVGEKTRSWPNAIKVLEAQVANVGEKTPLILAVYHTDVPALAREFYQRLETKVSIARGYISELSASLAVHGGPGMLGAAFCPAHLFNG